jgi:eukaryotic-like serine/threonine-protein kinase
MNTSPTFDTERLRQLNALLEVALALPPGERAAWLRGLPAQHQGLVPRLAAMLARDDDHSFMREPVPYTTDDFLAQDPTTDRPGDDVGPWRLLRELGAGGMATVWLAERSDGHLRRQVALKLPRLSWAPDLKQRMARERDILASLEHPRIARLYDAGVTAQSRPWLAMEFVDGVSITDHAQTQQLDVRERLALFVPVLRAVQHAHAQLVIHRDIKPANVLVDREGRVKLLDFGVAKLIDAGAPQTSEHPAAGSGVATEFGGRALTPQYASPEQVAGQSLGTASDVYSLGVLLYELLTGALPYTLERQTVAAMEDAILSAQIRRPSQAAVDANTAKALRGDVDTLVLMALQTQPSKRYASAEAFAQDIERYLKHLPILAQPDSLGYRLRKLWMRQKLLVSAGALVTTLLITGVAAVIWQAHQTRQQAERAEAVQALLLDVFRTSSARQADPQRARNVTARELLEIGAQRLEGKLADQPRTRLALLGVMRTLHLELGLETRAAEFAREAVALTRSEFGDNSLEYLGSLSDLLAALQHEGKPVERAQVAQAGLEALARVAQRPSQQRIDMLRGLAGYFQSTDLPRANQLATLAVAQARRLPTADALAGALFEAGNIASVSGHFEAAVPLLEEALSLMQRGDPTPFDLVRARVTLGQAQIQTLRVHAGEASLRVGLDESLRANGTDHIDTRQAKLRLGSALMVVGRLQDAVAVLLPLRAELLALPTPDHFTLPLVAASLGQAQQRLGQLDEAEAVLRHGITTRDEQRPNTLVAADLREYLSLVLLARERIDDAEALRADAERIRRANGVVPGQSTWRRQAHVALALARARNDGAAARRHLGEMQQQAGRGDNSPHTLQAALDTLSAAQVELDEGQLDAARTSLTQLQRWFGVASLTNQLPILNGQLYVQCARLAQLEGEPGLAEALLARAQRDYASQSVGAASLLMREWQTVRATPPRPSPSMTSGVARGAQGNKPCRLS